MVLARPKAGLSFRVDEFGGGILVDGNPPLAAYRTPARPPLTRKTNLRTSDDGTADDQITDPS
jgi:hypothetical protein